MRSSSPVGDEGSPCAVGTAWPGAASFNGVEELSDEHEGVGAKEKQVSFSDAIHAWGVVWAAVDGTLQVVPLKVGHWKGLSLGKVLSELPQESGK